MNLKKFGLILAALKVLTFNDADAQLSARVDAATNYMFRGHKFTDCSVIQPSVRYSKGLDLTLFGNYNTKNKNFDELDINVNNTHQIGDFTLSEGFTHVYEPDAKGLEYINEFYFSAEYPATITPKIAVIKPFGTIGGIVAEASITYTPTIAQQSVSLSALLGYEKDYLSSLEDPEEKGLSHLEFKAGTEFDLIGAKINPTIAYTIGFGNMPTMIYAGIGITKSIE